MYDPTGAQWVHVRHVRQPARRHEDGSVILGKNSDREPNEAHELLAVPATDHESSQVRTTYIEIDQILTRTR